MKNGELKRRIEEYLAMGMSEFKEKGDQGEGLFVTHLVKSSRIRVILNVITDTRRQSILSESEEKNVLFHICKNIIYDRYSDMCQNHSFSDGVIDIVTATDFLNYAFEKFGFDLILDGRNVIDKYYELNASKKADDTISILEVRIPRGSSNGDVFKAVFPHGVDMGWWSAPYAGKED